VHVKYLYGGDAEQTYPQYLNLDLGKTLVAEPGQTYDVGPAEGLTVADGKGGLEPAVLAMPPDDRWSKLADRAPKTTSKEN
jgi:hypothetical protein